MVNKTSLLKNQESPFSDKRFELERKHLYYLPFEKFSEILKEKSSFIIGSRGTGKTTLLQALSWIERQGNEDLKKELSKFEHFNLNSLIGLYLNSTDNLEVSTFHKWLNEAEPEIESLVFSFYVDLAIVQLATLTISGMISKGFISLNIEEENSYVASLVEKYHFFKQKIKSEKYLSIEKLSDAIRDVFIDVANSAKRRVDPIEIIEKYKLIGIISDLGITVIKTYCEICNKFVNAKVSDFRFVVCLDESECFGRNQQMTLNTMIRSPNPNLRFIVSYVRERDDFIETFKPNLSLGDDDRHIIRLDKVNEKDFIDLVEGVSTVRINYKMPDWKEKLSVQNLLGKFNVNQLLSIILKNSETKYAKVLIDDAKQLSQNTHFKSVNNKYLPIYESYLIKLFGIELPKSRKSYRNIESRYIRKFVAMAYVNICSELSSKTKPIYAFDKMIFDLSDYCIRYFLDQMDSLFHEMKCGLSDFVLKNRIDIQTQNKAIRKASERKFNALDAYVSVGDPNLIHNMILGIAELTKKLQMNNKLLEYGLFSININDSHPRKQEILALIEDASDNTLLVSKKDKEKKARLLFRIHGSLAAHFGLSYRPGYYPRQISFHEIESLIISRKNNSIDPIVERILQESNPEEIQSEQISF